MPAVVSMRKTQSSPCLSSQPPLMQGFIAAIIEAADQAGCRDVQHEHRPPLVHVDHHDDEVLHVDQEIKILKAKLESDGSMAHTPRFQISEKASEPPLCDRTTGVVQISEKASEPLVFDRTTGVVQISGKASEPFVVGRSNGDVQISEKASETFLVDRTTGVVQISEKASNPARYSSGDRELKSDAQKDIELMPTKPPKVGGGEPKPTKLRLVRGEPKPTKPPSERYRRLVLEQSAEPKDAAEQKDQKDAADQKDQKDAVGQKDQKMRRTKKI